MIGTVVGVVTSVGLVARPERVILLAICLIIGQPMWALWALAILTHVTAITRILPPASRFAPGGDHGVKKQRVLDKLAEFFDRYFGLV